MEQVQKLRVRFGLEHVVLVGDRGMLTETRIEELKKYPGLGWISALRSHAIGELVEQGVIQLSLFDERNMAEISSETYPGERLIVCRNPLLAEDRGRTRKELLDCTERRLKRIEKEVKRRTKTLLTAGEIGLKVGRVVDRYKVSKHFDLDIRDGYFAFTRNEEQITQEAALDGIYIIRTSEPQERLSAEDTVRAYKSLTQVERAFRCLKGIDLSLRPICHRTEAHVKAHVFLCMLAYYVEWHLRRALSSVLFQDDELSIERLRRDPVAKAQPSASARRKKQTKCTEDGFPVHSLKTLMTELATRCKNTCRIGEGKNIVRFTQFTEPTPFQHHVFALLAQYSVSD
jgi:transposase